MTVRMGPKGQVVIPKEIRDRLGLAPGDEVDVFLDGDAARVVAVADWRSFGGRFRGVGLVRELE